MAFRRRNKSYPFFSQEFLIQNHADIVFTLVIFILIGLMFEVSPTSSSSSSCSCSPSPSSPPPSGHSDVFRGFSNSSCSFTHGTRSVRNRRSFGFGLWKKFTLERNVHQCCRTCLLLPHFLNTQVKLRTGGLNLRERETSCRKLQGSTWNVTFLLSCVVCLWFNLNGRFLNPLHTC